MCIYCWQDDFYYKDSKGVWHVKCKCTPSFLKLEGKGETLEEAKKEFYARTLRLTKWIHRNGFHRP